MRISPSISQQALVSQLVYPYFTTARLVVKCVLVLLLILPTSGYSESAEQAAAEPIKLSRNGICHSPDSRYYRRVKRFTAFQSMESCLGSGGRLPKGSAATSGQIRPDLSVANRTYNRKNWRHWLDEDDDCQNTRAEVLISSSNSQVGFSSKRGCAVVSGNWQDPYSGKHWYRASDLDVDHIVPLKWAYEHGAAKWTNDRKRHFANDFSNLLAVEDNLNQAKGAKGPDQWLPPNRNFHCRYLLLFDTIVKRYRLSYRQAERDFIALRLQKCGTFND